jgi:hypothetical protein
MRFTAALAILGLATASRAGTVTNEVFVKSAPSLYTNVLRASFDPGADWTVSGGASLTFQGESAPLGEKGATVAVFTAGADWSATENLTLSLAFEGSPKSTQFTGTVIGLRAAGGAETTAQADLRSQTAQIGAGAAVSWDTLGLSDLEWSFDLGVDFSHYDIDQSISTVRSSLGAQQLRQQIAAYCLAHPRVASCAAPGNLEFERVSGTVLSTLFSDTDVSLSADWYVYNHDPAETASGAVLRNRGANLPIAPLQYLVRPEVLHRFGAFSVKAWAQAGEYVSGTGLGTSALGLKLQYRFSKAFRAWVTASGQRDVDATDRVTRSGTISVGAGYRF